MSTLSAETAIRRLLELPAESDLLDRWAQACGWPAEDAFDRLSAQLLQTLAKWPDLSLHAVRHVRSAVASSATPMQRAKLMRLHAHALRAVGNTEASAREYARARESFADHGERVEAGRTCIGEVYALGLLGRLDDARRVAAIGRRLLSKEDLRSRERLEINLGDAYLHAAQLDQASRSYHQALELCRLGKNEAGIGVCLHNLAIVADKRGETQQAAELYRQALEILSLQDLGMPLSYCEARLALTDLATGQLERGFDSLQRLHRRFGEVGDRRAESLIRREIAVGLLAVGAVDAARDEALAAMESIRGLGLGENEARLEALIGRLFSMNGWYQEAHYHLTNAQEFYRDTKNRWMSHRCSVDLARILVLTDRPRDALRLLAKAQRYLDAKDPHGDGALCHAVRAEAQLAMGRSLTALKTAQMARRRATHYPASLHQPLLSLLIAEAHGARESHRHAVTWARRAVDELEQLLQRFGSRPLQETLAESRDRIYQRAIDLVLRHSPRRSTEIALNLLSQARSAVLVEDCLEGLAGQEHHRELRGAIAKLRDELLDQPSGMDVSLRHENLQQQIDRLARRLQRRPRRAPEIVRQAEVARATSVWAPRLGDRELVVFDRSTEGWRAFVVQQDGSVRLCPLPMLDQVLMEDWRPLRLTFQAAAHADRERRHEFLERTREDSSERFERLQSAIWDPVGLEQKSVIVIPYGPLHDLPLEALAVDRAESLTRLPHPGLVATPSSRRRARRRRNALVLHGAGSGTRSEAEGIARVLRRSEYSVEVAASRSALEEFDRSWGVVHIATHGTVHPQGWLLSGLQLDDGWIGFESLYRPAMKGALLYLSSCESGIARRQPGANLEGWLTAGLGAGARELMLTLWRLDDDTAKDFASSFYDAWAEGHSASVAATRARESLRRRAPHPFSWAPFISVG